MAEETKKSTTTTKKRTTTSKPKVEEPKPQLSIEEQMAQMMAMMMAQQQQLMELMAKQQQEPVNTVVDEVVEKPKRTKRTRNENRITKQDLRRKYKGVDIYVANVSQGYVAYHGKNMTYEWKHNGDIEIVSIDDIINMPKSYLSTPWLCLDGYENDEEMIDEIVDVLKLGHVYEYIYTLQDMEENINEVGGKSLENLQL